MDASRTFTVTADDTAEAVGSGSLPVLGTPRLLAWCEAVTCAAIEPTLARRAAPASAPGSPSSTWPPARSAPRSPSPPPTSYVDGRLVRFMVAARQGAKLVGNGEVTRVVVDAEKFLSRL